MNGRPANKATPYHVFCHAERFHAVQDALRRNHNQDFIAASIAPVTVISAFSCELYLKTLVLRERGTPTRIHNLEGLFCKLAPHTRDELTEMWNSHLPEMEEQYLAVEKALSVSLPRDLRFALRSGARTFEMMRYAYEADLEGTAYFLCDFPYILRRFILSLEPSWA
jgi:hypothetical protein